MPIIFDRSPSPKPFTSATYMAFADAAAFTPSGDFTIELFDVTFSSTAGTQQLYAHWNATGNQRSISFEYVSGTGLRTTLNGTGASGGNVTIGAAWSPSTATPYDIALDRSGTTVRLYIDGAIHTSGSFAGALFNSTASPGVGHFNGSNALQGTIKAFRLTVGTARYAGAYTPPSLPLPTS